MAWPSAKREKRGPSTLQEECWTELAFVGGGVYVRCGVGGDWIYEDLYIYIYIYQPIYKYKIIYTHES